MSRIASSSYKVNSALEQIVEISNSSAIPVSEDADIVKWGGVATSLGQKASSASVPVVIASDQTGVSVDLDSVSGDNLSLGQKTKASSLPVTLASDEDTLAVSLTQANNNGTAGNLSNAQVASAGDFSTEVDTRAARNISISGLTTDTTGGAIEIHTAVASAGTKYKNTFSIFPDSAGYFSQDLSGVAINYLSLKYTVAGTITSQALFN
jgi:hypothetical protein